jgi:hypothetical protein
MELKEWKRTESVVVLCLPHSGLIKRALEIRVGITAAHCYVGIRRDKRGQLESIRLLVKSLLGRDFYRNC